MRALAEFFMKSRSRAIGSAVATAFVPFLSVVSGAILALVWLRMGRREGLILLGCASLPGIYYLVAQGSPDILLTLLAAGVLAETLRSTQAWSQVLVTGTALACMVALGFQWLPDSVRDDFIGVLINQGALVNYEALQPSDQERLKNLLGLLLNGVITAVQILMIFLSLFLARWWQASLYNPGGFQSEFHQIRMPLWYSGVLLVVALLMLVGIDVLSAILPVLVVPLLISALALVHGVVAIKQYNTFWLGMLYVLLLFALPYLSVLLVLIAMADSLMNFRQRLAPSPPPPPNSDGDDRDA